MPCSKVQALGPASGPEPPQAGPPASEILAKKIDETCTHAILGKHSITTINHQHFACMAPIFVGAAPILRSVKGSTFKSEILVPRDVPVSMSCSTFFSTIFYSCHDVSMGGAHEVCSGA